MILKGDSASFTVDDVSSSITLPTTLKIGLRQESSASLAFVTITDGDISATILIDANDVATATYTLVLESYNSNSSSPQKTLKTDTVTVYVTDYVRSTAITSYQVVMKGSQATFSVDNVSSSITLPTTAKIALRQKTGANLSFVTITNGATSASVAIDATGVTTGTYTLVLESYDSSAGSSLTTLKSDAVTVYVTDYVRSTAITSYQVVMKGSQATFSVDNVSSSITLPTTAKIALRQKTGANLSFVTITNGATSASVAIDVTGVSTGTYTLVLESYDSSAGSSLTTLKSDAVTVYVTEYIHSSSVESSIYILKGNSDSFTVDHVFSLIDLPTSPAIALR